MQLLTKKILSKLPAFGSTDYMEPDQIKVVVKFFTPWSNWTWYAIEGSYVDADGYFNSDKPKVDFLFYGWVEGYFSELGSFRLSELESLTGPFGLRVERDLYYTPQTLQELMDKCNLPF